MNEQDILNIVNIAFENEIEADSYIDEEENIVPYIDGKERFFKEVTEKLKKLFEDNDLTK